MAEIVALNATSGTAQQRERFEAFVRRGCTVAEADTFLTRSRGGEYVMATTRAGWASWQAAIQDLIELYQSEQK
jgi:hypothetical protein